MHVPAPLHIDGQPLRARRFGDNDCDDDDDTSNPDATEYCDQIDHDCSGVVVDAYASGVTVDWYTGVLCQSAIEIQSILGCAFDCAYCPYTFSVTIACDVEEFVRRLLQLMGEHPEQQLYKLNNRSDTLCFEPEYGLCRDLVERFGR